MDFEQFQSGIDTPDAKAFQNTLGSKLNQPLENRRAH